MNILIVDDNKNNRMILRLLLEDYIDDHDNIEFIIDEVSDGEEAVEACKDKSYDIVFMDIMMPNMDGIEATKIIRGKDKKTMIIAVSAVDDSNRQKLILSNGAEDYISKPVNSDIFNARIANYITLVESREHKKRNIHGINLFTKDIFSRHINFIISSEDSLSEFWEYYLLDSENKCDDLSDVIRTIFAISEAQIRLKIDSDIYVEDSEEDRFFTLTKVDQVPSRVVELMLRKNALECEYKLEDDKLSFKLPKKITIEADNEMFDSLPVQDMNKSVSTFELQEIKEQEIKEEIASEVDYSSSSTLEVYDYIEEEDLFDLEEFAGKLSSLMLIVGSGDVTEEDVIEIYTYIDKIGSIISTYPEVYPISKALTELALDMSTHISEFVANSESLGPMCTAFSQDLLNWIEQSFHTGAPSADFMNDTIVVNCQTISSMLKMDEVSAGAEDDFDDIFDF
jgi:two-component system chemotaxis response regulator CheY